MKLLLALQYWEGDRERAHQLADLLVRLPADKVPDVGFLLSARHDAKPPDPELVTRLRGEFRDSSGYVCPVGLRGYPGGCNSLWRGTVLRAAELGYDYVLTFEADCSPLVIDWVARLKAAVAEAQTRYPNAVVFGAQQGRVVGGRVQCAPHINGNAVFRLSPGLVELVRKYSPLQRAPWDIALYPEFQKRGTVDLREIQSDWRSRGFTPEGRANMLARGVVFHHGCRDASLTTQLAADAGIAGSGEAQQEPPDALQEEHVDMYDVRWVFATAQDPSRALVATSRTGPARKLVIARTPAFDAAVSQYDRVDVAGVRGDDTRPCVVLRGTKTHVIYGDQCEYFEVRLSDRRNSFRIRSVG